MEVDSLNFYRSVLEKDLPEFVSKVNTPWDNLPDYADFNATAYRRITRDLQKLNKACMEHRPISRGILILGESGTGKTHLLMRAAHHLANKNHILFVRRPNVEDAVAQHVWAEIVRSLARDLPTSGTTRCQLDELLAHVFSSVLLSEFERDLREGKDNQRVQRWTDILQDPYNIFQMIGEGESGQSELKSLRQRTLRYLQQTHPEVDQQIAYALITYCLVSSDRNKRIILTWLSGQDMDEKEAQLMGLPPQWIPIEDGASDVSVQQRREEQALRAIRTIGVLSTYFQPLILAFDQLEGLRDEPRLTQRWGDVVREIFTMAPNFLVVTCIYPSLWKEWFEQILDTSAVRRIAEQCVTLEPFQPEHARQLLEKQMEGSFKRHGLPTRIYPFDTKDISKLCARAKSPAHFIQAAEAELQCWLDGTVSESPIGAEVLETLNASATTIDSVLQRTYDKFERERRATYERDVATEQDFFGRIHVLLKAILTEYQPELGKASCGHYVMPSNLVVSSRNVGDQLCIAILNSHGRAFTSRIGNFLSATRDRDQFRQAILMRDCRCNLPTQRGQELLKEFQRLKRTNIISVDAMEYVMISALYDTLVAIEEQTVSVGDLVLGKRHLVEFISRSGLARQSQLFRAAAKWSQCIDHALNGAVSGPNGCRVADEHVRALPSPSSGDAGENDEQQLHNVIRHESDSNSFDQNTNLPAWAECSGGVPSLTGASTSVIEKRADAEQDFSRQQIDVRTNPTIHALIGDSELDSPHAGVMGILRNSNEILGISLNKPQCIVLLGYMGSGKSYALGVLIENALLANSPLVRTVRPMTVVAFNYRRNSAARFEYRGYSQPNSRTKETDVLSHLYQAQPSATGSVRVFGYGPELVRRASDYEGLSTLPIHFRADELGAAHWEILMKPPTPQAEYMDVIRDIIQDLYYQNRLSYKNLEKHILDDDRLNDSQRKRAMNRLSFAARWIVDDRSYEWADVLQEGTLNVFDLRMQTLESDEALKLCLVITDLVRRTRNFVNKLIVFDEAHEYVDSKQLVGELENALTQIRHDGLSFVLASQFPERIPENILRFFDTRFIFKLPTEKAITYLKKSAPNLKSLSQKQVANLGLEKGTCFVQSDNDCTNPDLRLPQMLEIRPRCSHHGGATVRHT